MPRAMWTGAISFGLVNVPIRLFSAVSQKEVHFHMLHGKDGGRIRLKRVCSIDGEEVPYEEIVKGHELSRGQYVVIDPKELEALDPKASRTIEIEDFVDIDEIDPIYFERTYYTAPDRGAAKAYSLLLDAMRDTGKVAIARMVMRTKGYLCCVRPMGNALALSTMLYADEVVAQEDVDLPDVDAAKPKERELDMAKQLVESLATEFVPEKYRDRHRDRVLELIERKAEGRELVTQPEEEPSKVVNLADALAKSLASARERQEGRISASERPRAAARTATERKPARKSAQEPSTSASKETTPKSKRPRTSSTRGGKKS